MPASITHEINMQVDKRNSSAPICGAAAHIYSPKLLPKQCPIVNDFLIVPIHFNINLEN